MLHAGVAVMDKLQTCTVDDVRKHRILCSVAAFFYSKHMPPVDCSL
jgi:hypothetical protein